MNLQEFDEKYVKFKSAEKITINCDNPNCEDPVKTIGKQPARRNIQKNGGKQFVCRDCFMKYNNPMNRVGQSRQTDEEVEVACPKCKRIRTMKKSCYYGDMDHYEQVCGTCAQKGKVISEAQKEAISQKLTGRTLAEEHRLKILEFRKNNPEWAEKANRNLIPGMGGIARKGLPLPEEWKQAISDGTKGVEKTKEHAEHISVGRKAMLDAQGGLLPETKEKLSKATAEQFKRGFEPAMHHRRGKYYSKKLNRELYYKSSYELKAFMLLDADPNVVDYEYEPLPIEYVKPGTNYNSNYLIDLKVIYADGRTELIEVKPKKRSYGEIEQAKSKAATEYCEQNGYAFKLWTEVDLFASEKEMRKFVEEIQ